MNIDPNNNAAHVYANNLANRNAANQPKSANPNQETKDSFADKLDLSTLNKVRNEPEVRPEVVAKGKELLNDPNFPSKDMINSIAKLIVPFADDE